MIEEAAYHYRAYRNLRSTSLAPAGIGRVVASACSKRPSFFFLMQSHQNRSPQIAVCHHKGEVFWCFRANGAIGSESWKSSQKAQMVDCSFNSLSMIKSHGLSTFPQFAVWIGGLLPEAMRRLVSFSHIHHEL
jgi:hypothetical protein